MVKITTIKERQIYTDLMRKFHEEGHTVYIISPLERRSKKQTGLIIEKGVNLLCVRTLNLTKTNVVEKGIGQLSLEWLFKRAYKKHFCGVKFDLILYSTPPITLTKVITYAKKMNSNAVSYLMLKDIFPQNAVDLGMLSKSGVSGLIYKSFRNKESRLYELSDYIGCMSPANVTYLLNHNSDIPAERVEICPNSFELINDKQQTVEDRVAVRQKYGLPINKPILFYGGNLGKPQGVPFLIECLNENRDRDDCHFVVVGNGVDYPKLMQWFKENAPKSVSVYKSLPKEDYDELVEACDIGMIFLDYRFTIPNYPSRLLNCLMLRKPIIASTDPNSDIGTIAQENGYGMYCHSNNVNSFTSTIDLMLKSDIKSMGEMGYNFLLKNYTVDKSYNVIMNHLKK